MTVEIKPHIGDDARPVSERCFHFCCFGHFSGRTEPRDSWTPLTVDRNHWDGLFESLQPGIDVHVVLPKVDDLTVRLRFRSLKDFREKGVVAQVPLLQNLTGLMDKVNSASHENPFDINGYLNLTPDVAALRPMTQGEQGEQVIDLLNMVDIGAEEDDDGLKLPEFQAFFEKQKYEGEKRSILAAEIGSIRRLILDQITGDPAFKSLHGLWRALKSMLAYGGPVVRITLVDCLKDELCDATFTLFIKPASGQPQPLDLAFYCDSFGLTEADHHVLFHLGRMAESLSTPFILNADLAVFQCKTWRHLGHLRDISGKLSGPAHIKWRKLRDEPGSQWLFLALNPFLVLEAEENESEEDPPSAPASIYLAAVLAFHLKNGDWPSELLGPLGHLSTASNCVTQLDEDQGNDLAFEGFCAVSGRDGGETLAVLGMNGFGNIKVPMRDQVNPANLVEFTLSYRLFSGCCSRFLENHETDPDLLEKLKDYVGLEKDEDLQHETADDQRIFRIKAPFPIFGVRPDLILALATA